MRLGQKIFLGCSYNGSTDEAVVTKVGRKYFYAQKLEDFGRLKENQGGCYCLETGALIPKYTNPYSYLCTRAFAGRNECEDFFLRDSLINQIRNFFKPTNEFIKTPTEKLQKVVNLLSNP